MIFLIGLGNPGKKYTHTRHNAGRIFVQYLKKHPIGGLKATETDCMMNQSGSWLKAKFSIFNFPRPRQGKAEGGQFSNLFIAYDDLDLPLQQFKIQWGRGPRDHKGLNSIYEALGSKNFWHVRLGIATSQFRELKTNSEKLIAKREMGRDYVLSSFKKDEKKVLQGVFPQIALEIARLINDKSRQD